MIVSKWMKWAVTGALAAAFPAVAMAHTHKSNHLTTATVTHAKKLSVHHHKTHKLTAKHRSASKLVHTSKKAKPLHAKRHSAIKLHSKKKSAVAM
jgi:hypothetical protein